MPAITRKVGLRHCVQVYWAGSTSGPAAGLLGVLSGTASASPGLCFAVAPGNVGFSTGHSLSAPSSYSSHRRR